MKSLAERLTDLATCLCAQIEEDANGGAMCFCGIIPGTEVAHDYLFMCSDDDDGACGLAYVQMDVGNPGSGVGVENIEINNCGSLFTFQVEIGILRCITAGDEQGNPPPPEELNEAALLQYADIMTMRRAVQCCQPKPYVLGAYTPYGPTGGVYGGTFSLTLLEE